MVTDAFYIESPHADQSFAIARLLKTSLPAVPAIALEGRERTRSRYAGYSGVVSSERLPVGANVVHTTAAGTEAALKRGPITLGDITLGENALAVYEKRTFLSTATLLGIPVPQTYDVRSPSEFEYPVFYKEAHEKGGGTRGIAQDMHEVPADLDRLIVQEYVDTPGTYGVAFLANEGEILVSEAHYEVTSFPRRGGSAVTLERFTSARLNELSARLIEGLDYSGWGLVEFKWSKSLDDFVLMEINAKMWASVEFSFRNCPRMFELLFGVRPTLGPVARMTFVHRLVGTLGDGVVSAIANTRGSELVRYPGAHRYGASAVAKQIKRLRRGRQQ